MVQISVFLFKLQNLEKIILQFLKINKLKQKLSEFTFQPLITLIYVDSEYLT